MNRAFHIAGMVWLAGIFSVGLGFSPLVGAVVGALTLAVLIVKGRLPLWTYAAAAAFCASMLSLVVFQGRILSPAESYVGTVQQLRARVTAVEAFPAYRRLVLEIDREAAPLGLGGTRVRISVPAALEVLPGDVVNYKGRLLCPDREREALFARGLRFLGESAGEVAVVGHSDGLDTFFSSCRERVRRTIKRQLPGEEGDLLMGMVTGETGAISPDLRYAYARTGIAHLLAVSGLHLAVLTGLLDCILVALALSRRQRGAVEILAVLCFMAFTGFSYSVVRAGIMAILCRLALLLGRDNDALNALGFALVLLLLQNPYAAYSISLQLSYLATMGIAAFASPLAGWMSRRFYRCSIYRLEEAHPWRCAVLYALSTTLGASVLIAPLLVWQFGQLSLVSPLTNLLVTLPGSVALSLGMLCGICGFFPELELFAHASGLGAGLAVKLVNQTASALSALPFAALPMREGYQLFWLTAVLLLGVLLWLKKTPAPVRRYAICLLTLPLLAGVLVHAALWGRVVRIAIPEKGGAIAVACGKQGAVLGAPDSVYEARNLRNFLRDNGVKTIALLAAETKSELYGNPAALLLESFPVEETAALDRGYGFEAALFGLARVRAEGAAARRITLEVGGLRLVKNFEQTAASAHLLVNAKNELIAAPEVVLRSVDRYFGSTVFTLRAPPAKQGGTL